MLNVFPVFSIWSFCLLFVSESVALAGHARLESMGPGIVAVKNSDNRPGIPSHVNGMPKNFKFGMDLDMDHKSINSNSLKEKSEAFKYSVYGIFPFGSLRETTESFGLTVSASSVKSTGRKDFKTVEIDTSGETIVQPQFTDYEYLRDELTIGGVLPIDKFIVLSGQYRIIMEEDQESAKTIVSNRNGTLSNDLYTDRFKSGQMAVPELGARLILDKELYLGLLFKQEFYDKSRKNVEETILRRKEIEKSEYKDPMTYQGSFSMGISGRISPQLMIAGGVERGFEVKGERVDFVRVIHEEEYTAFGFGLEYEIQVDQFTWLPRVAAETRTTVNEDIISLGIGMQVRELELDASLSFRSRPDGEKQGHSTEIIFGASYFRREKKKVDLEKVIFSH